MNTKSNICQKNFQEGTNEVQDNFINSNRKVTAPHTRAIKNFTPLSCDSDYYFCNYYFCKECAQPTCKWQECKKCLRNVHAECGFFCYNNQTKKMESYCKSCPQVCLNCKSYVLYRSKYEYFCNSCYATQALSPKIKTPQTDDDEEEEEEEEEEEPKIHFG